MLNPKHKFRTFLAQFRYKYWPRLADVLVDWSTFRAQRSLKVTGPIKVLVDSNVLGYGITHETRWIPTGTSNWGGADVETGYAARIPVHSADDDSEIYRDITYLPGIAHLARIGLVKLMTSAELITERLRHPIGRYRGYGFFDFNVFKDINIPSVDGNHLPDFRDLDFFNENPTINMVIHSTDIDPLAIFGTSREEQQARLSKSKCALYNGLVAAIGAKNNLDAWHIRTAEKHGMFCFLTMDRKLMRNVNSKQKGFPLSSLETKLMTPSDLGRHLQLIPVPPVVLSYNDASFFVRPDLSSPANKRHRPRSEPK